MHHEPAIARLALLLATSLLPSCIGVVTEANPADRVITEEDRERAVAEVLPTCVDPGVPAPESEIRRLTREEVVHSIGAALGDAVIAEPGVKSAIEQIPPESSEDPLHSFTNTHVLQHVRGMLVVAEAIGAALATDPPLARSVLGECAASADRACAEAFLDTTALRLVRRPIDGPRREGLLAQFDEVGGGEAGMRWMLEILLQSPELAFHLDLREIGEGELECGAEPAEATFGWDDPSVFFATGSGQLPPQQVLAQSGWYVWQIPADAITREFTNYRIELAATTASSIVVDVNVDDMANVRGAVLGPGTGTVTGGITLQPGQPIKVGLQVPTLAMGETLEVVGLTLAADAAPTCVVDEPAGGVVSVDDYTVASRLSYALTGQGPDAALIEAAHAGALRSPEQVRPHAERLVGTAAARRQFEVVLRGWLHLGAVVDPNAAIASTIGIDHEGLGAEAVRELLDYAVYQTFDADAGVAELMGDRIGFPRSERMATLYGTGIVDGGEPVALPTTGACSSGWRRCSPGTSPARPSCAGRTCGGTSCAAASLRPTPRWWPRARRPSRPPIARCSRTARWSPR